MGAATLGSSVTIWIWQHGTKENYCNFAVFNNRVVDTKIIKIGPNIINIGLRIKPIIISLFLRISSLISKDQKEI